VRWEIRVFFTQNVVLNLCITPTKFIKVWIICRPANYSSVVAGFILWLCASCKWFKKYYIRSI